MSCSLHKWSITKIDRVVFKVLEVMGKSSRHVRTRSRTVAKLVRVLCERPFPDDGKSPDTSRNADAVNANLERNLEVLSAIKQTLVLSILRVSLSHSLYLSLSLSLSLSLQVCAVSWFTWKWRMALAWQPDLQMWWFWKKKTVWTVSLGLLSAAKFRPSSDTSGALPLVRGAAAAATTNWPWVRRVFRRRFIHRGN